MKKLLLFILLICIKQTDAQSLQWASGFGSAADATQGNSITHDNGGNCIVTGVFRGTVDFNPGSGTDTLTAIGVYDGFLSKYDGNGNYLWAFNIGANEVTAYSVCTDTIGNIYIVGSLNGTADFNPGPGVNNLTASAQYDAFIAKYSPNGNYLWAFNIRNANATSICSDNFGNVFVTGAFAGTSDFNPGTAIDTLTSDSNYTNIFVAKYDVSGNYIWAFTVGSALPSNAYSVSADANGNIFLTGSFGNSMDFNPGTGINNLTAKGLSDIYIAKYDSSGSYLWAFNIGASGGWAQSNGYSVSTDEKGNIYATGYFAGSTDFNPGSGTNNLTGNNAGGSVYVAKYDATGNYLWALKMGTNANTSVGYSICSDDNGNVLVTGSFGGTANFNPSGINNLTAIGQEDIFLAKYDSSGNYIWAFNVGSSGNQDQGYSVSADVIGNVWITGFYSYSHNDFDPNSSTFYLNGISSSNIFVAKYSSSPMGIQQIANNSQVTIYPNPTSDQFFIDGNTSDKLNVDLYDVNGRHMFSKSVSDKSNIDVTTLNEGVYSLTIKTADRVTNKKLVILR